MFNLVLQVSHAAANSSFGEPLGAPNAMKYATFHMQVFIKKGWDGTDTVGMLGGGSAQSLREEKQSSCLWPDNSMMTCSSVGTLYNRVSRSFSQFA